MTWRALDITPVMSMYFSQAEVRLYLKISLLLLGSGHMLEQLCQMAEYWTGNGREYRYLATKLFREWINVDTATFNG
jgi:hypothetical protein